MKFAKKVLASEKKVLRVTHFPQVEFPDYTVYDDLKYMTWTSVELLLEATHC